MYMYMYMYAVISASWLKFSAIVTEAHVALR